MTTLSCPRLLTGGRLTGPGAVTIGDGGLIAAVSVDGAAPADRASGVTTTAGAHVTGDGAPPADLALDGGVLTAGMVDLQLNGAVGVDLAGADADGWHAIAAHLATHGVTAFCPTFITAPVATQRAAIAATAAARAALGDGVAQPLGAHLEGPFLSPLRPGAHDPALLREPSPDALDELLDGADLSALAIVTLAPELPGAAEAIERLTQAGVTVSLGHSEATAAETAAAAQQGARLVTHLFNAQRAFTHREPGLPARALTDPLLTSGLIVDLHHVAPDAVRLAFAAAPGRIALVSDAVAAAGMPPGPFRIGSVEAFAHADGPPRLADGTLAGSALHLDEAVRNAVALGISAETALTAATAVPAAAIGAHDRGELAAGRRADLVWWDDDLNVRAVWIGGRRIDLR
jgi:N-acetylglucosamine-6-phosphate deacetylase